MHYTATTFPDGPALGCALYLRRCEAFGYIEPQLRDLWIDILDDQGDILVEVPVSARGFNYLRRVLRFTMEESCTTP